jgi:eukaryotic-like serine/threonine-protein kinase
MIQKLIHRDVKPENMLLGRHQEVLLSDFGIALMAQSSRYQSTRDMAGTIAYMAPEQIEAHPRLASDQYSLGVLIYEWLSADQPFHGSFTEIAIKHSVVPPPSLREKVPTLSSAVEQAVMTALSKDPKQRFSSVQVFVTALEQASQVSAEETFPVKRSPQPTDTMTMWSQSQQLIKLTTPPSESFIPTQLILSRSVTAHRLGTCVVTK